MVRLAALLVAVVLIAFAACGASDRVQHSFSPRTKSPVLVGDGTTAEVSQMARGEEARAVRNYWLHVDRANRSKRRPSARSAPTALQGVVQVTSGNWADLIASYPWPWQTAYRIMWCESRGNPNARNRSGATGLFQILGGPTEPAANVRQAFAMWKARGWQPWNASKRCWA